MLMQKDTIYIKPYDDKFLYGKDGIELSKDECLKLIKILQEESKIDQNKIKYEKRIYHLETELSCSFHYDIRDRKGQVYFARLENGLIKIGSSINSESRMKGLKNEFGNLTLLFTIDVIDRFYYEYLIQFIFKKYNVEREIFDFTKANFKSLIDELLLILKDDFSLENITTFMVNHDLDKAEGE